MVFNDFAFVACQTACGDERKHYKTNGFQRFSAKKVLQTFAKYPELLIQRAVVGPVEKKNDEGGSAITTYLARLGPTEGSAGLLLFKTLREHRRTPFVITASVFRAIGS